VVNLEQFSARDPRVEIFVSEDAAFQNVATRLTSVISGSLTLRHDSNIVLSAGNSITKILGHLSKADVEWTRVHWFLADERYVPISDQQSNRLQIEKILRQTLGPEFGEVLTADTTLSPSDAARDYASRIAAVNMFDLCVLSMGDDGHVASLFPKSSAFGSQDLCCAVYDSPKPPGQRITMTTKAFASIPNRWLLAVGSKKARAVSEYIRDNRAPVRQFDPTMIIADQAAYR